MRPIQLFREWFICSHKENLHDENSSNEICQIKQWNRSCTYMCKIFLPWSTDKYKQRFFSFYSVIFYLWQLRYSAEKILNVFCHSNIQGIPENIFRNNFTRALCTMVLLLILLQMIAGIEFFAINGISY